MRFRHKFPVGLIISCALWLAVTGGWLHRPGVAPGAHSMYFVSFVFWICLTSIAILGHLTSWWQIADNGIYERLFWKTRFVPWDEIQRIKPYQPISKTRPDTIEITYARTGPFSDRGSMVLWPQHRQQLLASLHSHLPPTVFEL